MSPKGAQDPHDARAPEASPLGQLPAIEIAGVADFLRARVRRGQVHIVGVTGSVASGKSTLCAALVETLSRSHSVETISTDGFLLSNATLAEKGLSHRKGFPESYDIDALLQALGKVRTEPTRFPAYSHSTYDVDPALSRDVQTPDILLVEGLALAPHADGRNPVTALDTLIYLDAREDDLELWFVERFLGLWRAAEADASSFYVRFRHLDEAGAHAFARSVWQQINLPNLRDHIVHAQPHAHLVLHKSTGHQLRLARSAPAP